MSVFRFFDYELDVALIGAICRKCCSATITVPGMKPCENVGASLNNHAICRPFDRQIRAAFYRYFEVRIFCGRTMSDSVLTVSEAHVFFEFVANNRSLSSEHSIDVKRCVRETHKVLFPICPLRSFHHSCKPNGQTSLINSNGPRPIKLETATPTSFSHSFPFIVTS